MTIYANLSSRPVRRALVIRSRANRALRGGVRRKPGLVVPYVKKLNILPLWSNWYETVGIQRDGAIRKFSADGNHVE